MADYCNSTFFLTLPKDVFQVPLIKFCLLKNVLFPRKCVMCRLLGDWVIWKSGFWNSNTSFSPFRPFRKSRRACPRRLSSNSGGMPRVPAGHIDNDRHAKSMELHLHAVIEPVILGIQGNCSSAVSGGTMKVSINSLLFEFVAYQVRQLICINFRGPSVREYF